MRKILYLILVSLLVMGLVLIGCGGTPSEQQEEEEEQEEEQEEELPIPLKIGMLQSLDWVVGLDGVRAMQIGAAQFNGEDGLDIGGTKYEIQLVLYDHHMDFTNARTGAESLIEDGCRYILGEVFMSAAMDLTDDAGVVMIGSTYDASNLDPKYEWHWSGAAGSTVFPAAVPILASFTASGGPEDRIYQGVFPDRIDGHLAAAQHENAAESAGLIVLDSIFYDFTATDLSSVGTLIDSRDPDILDSYGGDPALDAGILAAAYDAGWTGQIFFCSTAPAFLMTMMAGAPAVEGAVGIGWPTEFDTTAMADVFIADWTAEYGEWTFPEIVVAQELWILITAMQKAGSIEPEDIKAVLDNGMTFESPCGPGQMIARPDVGNSRTVDCIMWDLPIKQISGGEPSVVGTVSETLMKDVVAAMYGGS